MGLDARIRYTKMVIQQSFLSLLKKKPINKITVKEICEISEINRATFYKYYSDAYDLMEQMENELLAHIESQFPNLSKTQQAWSYVYVAQGSSGILQEWIAGGMYEPPEQVADFIEKLISGTLNFSPQSR